MLEANLQAESYGRCDVSHYSSHYALLQPLRGHDWFHMRRLEWGSVAADLFLPLGVFRSVELYELRKAAWCNLRRTPVRA